MARPAFSSTLAGVFLVLSLQGACAAFLDIDGYTYEDTESSPLGGGASDACDACAYPDEVCMSGACTPSTCADGVLGGDETAIDCGGSCSLEAKPCDLGEGCHVASDCASNICSGLSCVECESDADCDSHVCSGFECGFCEVDEDCPIGERCTEGKACEANLAMGTACTNDAECASGNCIDEVCCDQPCDGACMACSAAKKGTGEDGICDAVAEGLDPKSACQVEECKTGSCDGKGACGYAPEGDACGTSGCSGGVQDNPDMCDGAGECDPGETIRCGGYVCDTTADVCFQACDPDGGDIQCAATFTCVPVGICLLKNGEACTLDDQCASGSCKAPPASVCL